jgi:hypothetical protein
LDEPWFVYWQLRMTSRFVPSKGIPDIYQHGFRTSHSMGECL